MFMDFIVDGLMKYIINGINNRIIGKMIILLKIELYLGNN